MEVTWGERALAIVGLMIAGGLAYMALDVLLDGALTKGLTRNVRLATVTELPVQEPPAS